MKSDEESSGTRHPFNSPILKGFRPIGDECRVFLISFAFNKNSTVKVKVTRDVCKLNTL